MAKAGDTTKPRKPPSFRHLPEDRAKKLKRAWVEKQKIKSQWKTQKRKEGLLSKGQQLTRADEGGDGESVADGDEDNDEDAMQQPRRSETGPVRHPTSGGEDEDMEGRNESSRPRPRPPPSPLSRPSQVPDYSLHSAREEQQTKQKTSLRELGKQAYSRSSLHTHKADPLHRRRGSDHRGGRGSAGRGRGGGRDVSQRGRGRGQPDMRLRMNVMLEKIKRDFS